MPTAPGNEDKHYDETAKIQPVDLSEDWGLDFNDGSVVKYITRWRLKNGIKDLARVIWYINRQLARIDADKTIHLNSDDRTLSVEEYIQCQDLHFYEAEIIRLVLTWKEVVDIDEDDTQIIWKARLLQIIVHAETLTRMAIKEPERLALSERARSFQEGQFIIDASAIQ